MNALLLLKLIHLEQVAIRFVVTVRFERIKPEFYSGLRPKEGQDQAVDHASHRPS